MTEVARPHKSLEKRKTSFCAISETVRDKKVVKKTGRKKREKKRKSLWVVTFGKKAQKFAYPPSRFCNGRKKRGLRGDGGNERD